MYLDDKREGALRRRAGVRASPGCPRRRPALRIAPRGCARWRRCGWLRLRQRADVLTDKQSNGGSEAAALAVLTCHSIDQHLPRGSGLRVLNVRALLRSSSFPEVRCRAGDSYRRSRPQRMPGKRRLEVRRLCDRWRDRERPYRLGARSTRPSAGTSARSQRGLRLFGGEGVYRITSNGAGLRANVCAWPPSRPSSRKEGNAGHPLAKTTSVARPLRRNYSLYSRHTSFDSGSSLSSALASLHVG